LNDAALCRLALSRQVKVVHTFHFGNYPHIPARYRLLEGIASRAADRLVAVGIEQAKRVRSTFGLPERHVDVIANGVECKAAAVDDEWRVKLSSRQSVVIGTICTLIEQKGLPDLLRVAGALKQGGVNAVFVVVGDGVLRRQVEQQCAALGLSDTVLFSGWKTNASASMLPLFDVFFQPSLWEAMSMVVLEAMAAGKPVVATDVGDNRHAVVDGDTGFILERGDVAGMSGQLRRLIESPELRQAMGAAGRARHAAHYTVDAMARRYERLYLDVIGEHLPDTEGAIEYRCES
jgi:glycosyltransferase involved in cell wall biosynthesis